METKKLDVETKKLDVETKKLDVETKKLDVEMKKLDVETKKLDVEIRGCKMEEIYKKFIVFIHKNVENFCEYYIKKSIKGDFILTISHFTAIIIS